MSEKNFTVGGGFEAAVAHTPKLRMLELIDAVRNACNEGPMALQIGVSQGESVDGASELVAIAVNGQPFVLLPAEAEKVADGFEFAINKLASVMGMDAAQPFLNVIPDLIMGLRASAESARQLTDGTQPANASPIFSEPGTA